MPSIVAAQGNGAIRLSSHQKRSPVVKVAFPIFAYQPLKMPLSVIGSCLASVPILSLRSKRSYEAVRLCVSARLAIHATPTRCLKSPMPDARPLLAWTYEAEALSLGLSARLVRGG